MTVIMDIGGVPWKAEMEEAKEGVKIAGRTLNNLRYADDTTLMAGKKQIWQNW